MEGKPATRGRGAAYTGRFFAPKVLPVIFTVPVITFHRLYSRLAQRDCPEGVQATAQYISRHFEKEEDGSDEN